MVRLEKRGRRSDGFFPVETAIEFSIVYLEKSGGLCNGFFFHLKPP